MQTSREAQVEAGSLTDRAAWVGGGNQKKSEVREGALKAKGGVFLKENVEERDRTCRVRSSVNGYRVLSRTT